MERGYIKLFRALMDNRLWTDEPFTRGQAWVDLLMLANHKPGFFRVRGNRIDVKRGQVGWSVQRLAKRWGWSRGKAQRFLNELENDQQIEQQKNTVSSLITITNYEQYQGETDSRQNSRRTADGQQTDTNKNEKNEKKKHIGASGYPDDFERAWQKYPKRSGGNPKAKAFKAWNARLTEGHTAEEMDAGIDRYRRWVEATGKVGTEYVKQASTFLGTDKSFQEPWAVMRAIDNEFAGAI